MKNIFVIVILTLTFGCSKNKENIYKGWQEKYFKNSSEINSYKLGTNYFVRNVNEPIQLSTPFIDNQSQFESIFGVAQTMTMDKQSVKVDFSKEIVIPIILEETNISTLIKIDAISLIADELNISYSVDEMHPISYVIQPSEIIILERSELGDYKNLKYKFKKTRNVL